MLKRFEGEAGKRLLREQFKAQKIVNGDDAFADALNILTWVVDHRNLAT